MVPPDGDRFAAAVLFSTALLSAGASSCERPTASEAPIRIAAAADLSAAFEEMRQLFESRRGQKVSLSFGASGALAKQISEGAPFDLFAAANASYVQSAVEAGACDGATKTLYARGHLVAWTRKGGVPLRSLSDLQRPDVKHIAIANPEHAPYGKAAVEAMTRSGLWPALEGKLVRAENVREALQFAKTGNADAAIIAKSLVAKDDTGVQLPIDPAWHAPIEQTLVVCKGGKNAGGARVFAELVASQEGQRLLQRYGFGRASESTRK